MIFTELHLLLKYSYLYVPVKLNLFLIRPAQETKLIKTPVVNRKTDFLTVFVCTAELSSQKKHCIGFLGHLLKEKLILNSE